MALQISPKMSKWLPSKLATSQIKGDKKLSFMAPAQRTHIYITQLKTSY